MPRKIVVINSKGGCGKTTLSTNLASGYAARGFSTVLMDYDPQDSSTRWLGQRPETLAPIYGVAAAHNPAAGTTRSFQLRIPKDTERVILDTPASMKKLELVEILRGASAIIIPVLPSAIDSHVTAGFIRNLESMTRLHAPAAPVGIVANRVRRNTSAFKQLMRFLEEMEMPPITCLRDTQHYIKAAEQGLGIHEIKSSSNREDLKQWQRIFAWLEAPEKSQQPVVESERSGRGLFQLRSHSPAALD